MSPTPGPASPSPRAAHGMAYDSESDRVILFGGDFGGPTTYLADTWAYDLNANAWAAMEPTGGPSTRGAHAMAYDAKSDLVVLFGGVQRAGQLFTELGDTWTYDFNTNTWTPMVPVPSPPSRHGHAMAYDTESDHVILHGGHIGTGDTAVLFNDTWSYDVNTNAWTQRTPSLVPPNANFAGLAYDAESDRIVRFGGDVAVQTTLTNATLAYDENSGEWTRMNPPSTPSPRWLLRMAYDGGSDRIVLFGGYSPPAKDDTWAYDLNNDTWTLRAPATTPSGRLGHGLVYDAESDRVVLFGGEVTPVFGRKNNETWAYDYEADAWIPMLVSPSKPESFTAQAGDGQVTLQWSAPSFTGSSPIVAYRIYRGTGATGFSLLATVDTTSFVDVTVSNGVTYAYNVTAVNGEGESPPSSSVTVTPKDTTPPTLVINSPREGETLNNTTVMVAGTASDNGAIVRVEIGTDGVNWELATGTSSWSGTLILAEGPNTIFARATDGSNNEAEENITVSVETVPEPPPPRPSPWWEDPLILGILAAVAVGVIAVSLILLRRRGRP